MMTHLCTEAECDCARLYILRNLFTNSCLSFSLLWACCSFIAYKLIYKICVILKWILNIHTYVFLNQITYSDQLTYTFWIKNICSWKSIISIYIQGIRMVCISQSIQTALRSKPWVTIHRLKTDLPNLCFFDLWTNNCFVPISL